MTSAVGWGDASTLDDGHLEEGICRRQQGGHVVINDSADFWETYQPFGGAVGTDSGWARGTIGDFTDLQTMGIDVGHRD